MEISPREVAGKAIAHRLMEIVWAAYPPAQLRTVDTIPHREVQARFHAVSKMFEGPIPGAPNYSIEQSPIGVCWLITPSGLAILFNPFVAGSDSIVVPSNSAVYQNLAVSISLQATRPIMGPLR